MTYFNSRNEYEALYQKYNKKLLKFLANFSQLQTVIQTYRIILDLVIECDSEEVFSFILEKIPPLSEEQFYNHAKEAIRFRSVCILGVILKTMPIDQIVKLSEPYLLGHYDFYMLFTIVNNIHDIEKRRYVHSRLISINPNIKKYFLNQENNR